MVELSVESVESIAVFGRQKCMGMENNIQKKPKDNLLNSYKLQEYFTTYFFIVLARNGLGSVPQRINALGD
jgi:hypothetical protein